MSFPKAGVELIAEGASQYFSDLAKGAQSQTAFGASSQQAAGAINSFGAAADKNAGRVAALTEKLGFQQREFDILQKELEETKAKYGEGSTQAQKQQLALDKLGAAVKQTGSELQHLSQDEDKAAGSASKFGEMMTGALRQVGALITNFAANMGQKLVGFFTTDTINAAATFESTMSGVKAVLGPTAQEFDALTATAMRLGKETAFSAQEVGTAIEALGQNGLTAAQILNGAADATVYLAAATGTNLANAAVIATDTMADFNISAEDMEKAINGIAGVTVASKFGIDDYRLALAQAGGVAGAVGVSFDDFNTAITVTSSKFASGSDAGTSFKTFLGSLVPTSDKAKEKMQELGIILEDGSNQFYDAAGNMKNMNEIAQVLQDSIGNLSEEAKIEALKIIFGNDAMRTAIGLANAGAKGFDEVAASIAKVDAAGQAKTRMDNFNGAMEALRGSLETIQISIGTKVLPAFTRFLNDAVIPAVNAVLEFADGIGQANNPVTQFGNFVKDNITPALQTLGIVTTVYALSQLPEMITSTMKAVAAFAAQNTAMLATLGVYAMATVAIFAIAKAYQGLQQQIQDQATALLEGKKFWQDSTGALAAFSAASVETQTKLQPLADSIQHQRDVLEDQVKTLATRTAAGYVTEQQYNAEMVALNQQAVALEAASQGMQNLIQKDIDAAASTINATAQLNAQGQVIDGLPPKIKLTADELEKLAKEYEKIMQEGSKNLAELTNTHAQFLSDMATRQGEHEETMAQLMAEKAAATTEDQKKNIDERVAAEEKGYQQQTLAQARAYAEQAAAQRQALGEQLLAYIENQRQLGAITNQKAQEMQEATINHFGIMRDSTAVLFGEMARSVDGFAQAAGGSADDVVRDWGKAEDEAIDLKEKADALKDKYTMEIVADFEAGKITIQEARKELAAVPKRVNSEIVVTTVHEDRYVGGQGDHTSDSQGHSGVRAFGGDVNRGRPYIVGEHRPEVFVPETDGKIIPSLSEYNARYNPPAGGRESGSMTNINAPTTKTFQWTIVNPQPEAVNSLAAMVRLQQALNYG